MAHVNNDLQYSMAFTPRKKPIPPIKDTSEPSVSRRQSLMAGGIRIDGLGYNTTTKLEYGVPSQEGMATADNVGSGGAMAATFPLTSAPDYFADDTEESDVESTVSPILFQQLLGVNKTLEKQIETLRMRLDFDSKHHQAQKNAIMAESGQRLAEKKEEMKTLTENLTVKDTTLGKLTEENENKSAEISQMKRQLDALSSDVHSAKSYADELEADLATLTEEKRRLETGISYEDKDRHITELKQELQGLRSNLAVLEKELQKAREVMVSQGSRLRFMENDRKNMHMKFKEELAMVSQSMRAEVEKMRDVMKKQYDEMKILREQNVSMSRDIKDIRNLLVGGLKQAQAEDAKLRECVISPIPQASMVKSAGKGRSTFQNNYNSYSLQTATGLPVLKTDKKKPVTSRRK